MEAHKEKWESIVLLYDRLLQIQHTPIAALNRTYAFSKAKGKEAAILEARKLKLEDNHFYFMLLGELYKDVDNNKSKENFQKALELAKTKTDKQTIETHLTQLT